MNRTLIRSACLIFSITLAAVAGAVEVTDLTCKDGDLTLTGRLARPAGAGPFPAVVVVHEWWGRNAYAERRAVELAEAGYVALAADCYGAPASNDFPTAVERSKPFYADPGLFSRRLLPAIAALKAQAGVDGRKISAIGFCFGGSAVLQLARDGADLRGVVSFHGGLKTAAPAKAGAVKARILVAHGGADPFVPPADVAGFAQEMLAAGADFTFLSVPGAVHAFSNPESGKDVTNVPAGVPFAAAAHYDANAEARSLAAMATFLTDVNAK